MKARKFFGLMLSMALVVSLIPCVAFPGEKVWGTVTNESALKKLFVNKSKLKYPFSVQFRKTKQTKITGNDGSVLTIWCGEVNAKNSFGGYVGWSEFMAYVSDDNKSETVMVDGQSDLEDMIFVNSKMRTCSGSEIDKSSRMR